MLKAGFMGSVYESVVDDDQLLVILIIIIRAGTPLVSNSFHFSWNPKYIEVWDQYILVSS